MDRCIACVLLGTLMFAGCGESASQTGAYFGPTLVDYRWKGLTECPLHHTMLIETIEPIEAGHISWSPDYYRAQKLEFPVAMQHLTDYHATNAILRYCSKCREAEELFHERSRVEHSARK